MPKERRGHKTHKGGVREFTDFEHLEENLEASKSREERDLQWRTSRVR